MFSKVTTFAAVLSLVLVVPSLVCSFTSWLLGPTAWVHLGNTGLFLGFVLALVAQGNRELNSPRSLWVVVAFICAGLHGLGFAAMFMLFAYSPVVHSHHRGTVGSNLNKIAEAMHNYVDDHDKRLPPAALRSNAGKPLLSWRVVLLPYLGEEALYRKFRLDEPWDSDHNLALLDEMPKVYGTAYPDRIPPFTTRFQVFVGPGTPFETTKGSHYFDDFPDGTGDTVLVAEARDPVPWTKPVDIVYSPDAPIPELGPGPDTIRWRFYRLVPHRFTLAFASGNSRRLDRPFVTDEQLRHLIVRNDGKGWIEEP